MIGARGGSPACGPLAPRSTCPQRQHGTSSLGGAVAKVLSSPTCLAALVAMSILDDTGRRRKVKAAPGQRVSRRATTDESVTKLESDMADFEGEFDAADLATFETDCPLVETAAGVVREMRWDDMI